MPIHNSDIARIFNQVADLLEIREANPFRVRAYRNAARTVSDQPQSMAAMPEEGKNLSDLPGIGDDLAAKIDILATCKRGSPVMDRFAAFEDVDEVLTKGDTESSVRLRRGLQVDLRVVPEVSYGAALEENRIREFLDFVRRETGSSDLAWTGEPKFDRAPVEVVYENGEKPLEGKTFVFTGSLADYTSSERPGGRCRN